MSDSPTLAAPPARQSIRQVQVDPTQSREQTQLRELAQRYDDAAAAIELFEHAGLAETTLDACRLLAEKLQAHLRCERVIVGVKQSRICRIRAISDVAEIDHDSEAVESWQAVLDESVARESVSAWPPLPGTSPHQLLAHRQAAGRDRMIISIPLRLSTPNLDRRAIVGAIAVILPRQVNSLQRIGNFLSATSDGIALAIATAQKTEGGPFRCRWRSIRRAKYATRRRAAAMAAIIIVGILLLPIPYKVRSAAIVEPSQRRFCVAPHDGLLKATFVRPGDAVEKGTVLAQMDEQEITWELSSLAADIHREQKKLDAYTSAHQTADAVMAELETQRLTNRRDQLRFRQSNLVIDSPVAGIVLSGSTEQRENFPVKQGDALYEIASIDDLRAELSLAAEEINHVREGMPVEFTFDGLADDKILGEVERVRPRAEIRDGRNSFIVDVRIIGHDERMRPGMRGYGKVVSDHHSIGWIYFHRALEKLASVF